MTTYIAGTTAVLTVQWAQYPGGPATDVTAQTITIKTTGGATVLGPTSTGIAHLATGLYSYGWAISGAQAAGDYVVIWDATDADSDAVQASEVVSVVSAPATGTWCSVSDVPDICAGQTATATDVAAAQVILEGVIGRVWRVTDAQKRDYVWLKRACAYQSAYVNQHPEILTMMGIQSWSQDGMSFSLAPGFVAKAYIAPMALAQLNNLFRGSNSTIRYNSAFQRNRVGRMGSGFGGSVPWTDI
jgi:hypothetical protein